MLHRVFENCEYFIQVFGAIKQQLSIVCDLLNNSVGKLEIANFTVAVCLTICSAEIGNISHSFLSFFVIFKGASSLKARLIVLLEMLLTSV